jgi:ABC-type transport system involved in cytochrome c biogenesis permease subunit
MSLFWNGIVQFVFSILEGLSAWNEVFYSAAFMIYCLSFLCFVTALTVRKWSSEHVERRIKLWSRLGFYTAVIGLISHLAFFITRWYMQAHIPVSNMFEFMNFLGMMTVAGFIVIYLIFRTPALGVFSTFTSIVVLAYASTFPQEIQPLIPALKSKWLYIHVTTAAAGEAFFAVGFAAGLMYLMRTVNFKDLSKWGVRAIRGVEFTLFVIFIIIAFIGLTYSFKGAGYHAEFKHEVTRVIEGETFTTEQQVDYVLPPIVKPYASDLVAMDSFLGMKSPIMEAPSWMNGVNAGRKLNTVIWSILGGLIIYWLIRLIVRKPIAAAIQPMLMDIDPEDLDEISYRAIAIGFPLFTLGALIFASIWAHEEWGRFWGFDPKETWALITWLFYVAYLHLRLSRGWQGNRSAWLAVIGFVVVMFTLVGVNLVIAGLHSYAGV